MIMDFLRGNKVVAGILTVLRIYIGYKWLTAGLGKLKMDTFDAGGFIMMAAESSTTPAWWQSFLHTVAVPNTELFSFMVMWGEVLVGAALILGVFTNFAALMGISMNLSFLFSGAGLLDAQMAILTVFIVITGTNAGRYGLDRWIQPIIKKVIFQKKQCNEQMEKEVAAV
ncbi:DoxX family protein [Oceanobacillus sp. CAU 1775]